MVSVMFHGAHGLAVLCTVMSLCQCGGGDSHFNFLCLIIFLLSTQNLTCKMSSNLACIASYTTCVPKVFHQTRGSKHPACGGGEQGLFP